MAIIPAAGTGSRMQADLPKQYLKINNQTVLDITLEKFLDYEAVKLVVLVISVDDNHYQNLKNITNDKLVIIEGGYERIDSVSNALKYLYDSDLPENTGVLIHDAARPCITKADLDCLVSSFQQNSEACLLAAPVVDTLHQVDKDMQLVSSIDRSCLTRALTPQMAKLIDLKHAIRKAIKSKVMVTDDATALTLAGYKVNVVLGRGDNIKITQPDDLAVAEFFLSNQE